MTDDLSGILRGFVTAEDHAARSATPDPGLVTHALARRVGRRRAIRIGASTLTASVVVVGVALAAAHGLRLPEPVPPVVPGPSVSVEPTPSPTPTISTTPTPTPTTSAPPVLGTLGGMIEPVPQAWTPGLFERTDLSWHLVRTFFRADDGSGRDATVLVAPDGVLTEVPETLVEQEWSLLDWLPGTSRVLVSFAWDDVRIVDLTTGATVVEIPSLPASASVRESAYFVWDGTGDVVVLRTPAPWDEVRHSTEVVRIAADGSPQRTIVSVDDQAGVTLSPDRSLVLLNTRPEAVVYPVSGAPTRRVSPYPSAPEACATGQWMSDSEVLFECSADGVSPFEWGTANEYWLAGVAPASGARPSAARLVGVPTVPKGETVMGTFLVGGRIVVASVPAFLADVTVETHWWEVDGDGATALSTTPGTFQSDVDVVGSEIIGVDWSAASGDTPIALRAVDPVKGTTRDIVAQTGPDGIARGLLFTPAAPELWDMGVE